MTTLFMDPFVQYGGNRSNMLSGPWAQIDTSYDLGTPSWDSSGQTAFKCFSTIFANWTARRVLAATTNVLIMSARYGIDALPTADGYSSWFTWRSAGNATIATLWCGANGRLYLTNGAGTEIATTSGPVIVPQDFQHLEFKLDLGTNSFVLRVDDATGTGAPVINASGLGLSGGPIGQITFGVSHQASNQTDSPTIWTKDWITRDTSGTVNNGFNGDERVAALFAIADTATAGWTPRYYHEFGAGILSLTAASACVSAASAASTDLGAADFTIEGFCRFSSLPTASNYSTLMSKWDTANNKRSYRLIYGGSSFNANCLQFDLCTDGTSSGMVTAIQYPWVPDLDTWYHIALVRASGELLLFVNGAQFGLPIADAHTYYAGSEPLGIGGEIQGTSTVVAGTTFSGWFDETRLTVGYARYTTSFTTPTQAFPRGSGSDPQWANVALLSGYDSAIQDESSFTRALTARNGAAQFTTADGPLIGAWSTLGLTKQVPDDNSFLTAALTAATGTLTMTTQPSNGDTVTVGTKNGSTAAVYTFKTVLASAFDVLIDTTAQNTLLNLYNAINAGTGSGTKYGASTTANFDVTAIQLPAGQLQMSANVLGTAGNSVATTKTGSAASWGGSTLSGGASIPGPSDFKVQPPPPHTTQISAVQLNVRMFKSDAGPCTVQPALIGPLGGVGAGAAHPLTISPIYYGDIIETDPDTAGPITPTTIVNGKLRLNRTA